MEFLYLVIDSMFSYNGLYVVDLSSPGLTRLVGKIGSGKSSVFNSISQILFDQNPTEEGKDRIINDVLQKGCWGCVGFVDDLGDVYHVSYSRSHRKYGTNHKIYRKTEDSWEDISGVDKRDTKEIIQRILKYKYENFVASVYLSQDQINNRFLIGTAAERDAVFTDLMGLEFYNKAATLASNKTKEINESITKFEIQMNTLNTTLTSIISNSNEESLNIYKNELLKIEKEYRELEVKNDNVKKYNEIINFVNIKKGERDRIANRIEISNSNMINELNKKDVALADLDKMKNYIKTLVVDNEEFEKIKNNIEELLILNQNMNSSIRAEERLIDDRNSQILKSALVCIDQSFSAGAKCYACGQNINEVTLNKHKEGLHKEIEECEQKINKFKILFNENLRSLSIFDIKRISIQEIYDKKENAIKEILQKEKDINIINQTACNYEKIVNDAKNEYQECDKQINNYLISIEGMEKIDFNEVRFNELKEQIINVNVYIKNIEMNLEQKEKILIESKKLDEEIQRALHKKALYEWWINGYKLLKHYKLEEAAVILNDSCSKTLNQLHGSMQLEFDIESEYKDKKKGKKQKFEILVRSGRKKRVPIKLYSGGEKVLLSCAITSGLWDVGRICGRSSSNLLMLDEPASSLDEEHREKLAMWLEVLKTKAKTILFATHIDLGTELFDNELWIEKENDLSRITQNEDFTKTVLDLIPGVD